MGMFKARRQEAAQESWKATSAGVGLGWNEGQWAPEGGRLERQAGSGPEGALCAKLGVLDIWRMG